MSKLVFIIPFYNCELYIEECLRSLIAQDYRDWIAIIANDASTDNSLSRIPNDSRIKIYSNTQRITALPNIHYAITSANLDDDDIICILDGDDKLAIPSAASIIKSIYTNFNSLLTYGQYITSQGFVGHCRPYTLQTFKALRSNWFWASHLRTFKYKLYKNLILQDPDLLCFKNAKGEFYTMAYDVAMMTPLLEIAGYDKIFFNSIPLYFYRIHANNDHIINLNLQTSIAHEIYAKPKFRQVF